MHNSSSKQANSLHTANVVRNKFQRRKMNELIDKIFQLDNILIALAVILWFKVYVILVDMDEKSKKENDKWQ